jgi:hypothetical protein
MSVNSDRNGFIESTPGPDVRLPSAGPANSPGTVGGRPWRDEAGAPRAVPVLPEPQRQRDRRLHFDGEPDAGDAFDAGDDASGVRDGFV